MNDLESKIKSVVAKHYGIAEDQVKGDSSFVGDLGGDSLDIIELLLTLEDKHGIVIPEEVAENLDTVQKVYDYINSQSNDTLWG
jgi:acyl carrier protein